MAHTPRKMQRWLLNTGAQYIKERINYASSVLKLHVKASNQVMRLALYQPDIPQNTGTILRLAACLGVEVDVIGPTGFDMTDRALRRSGLDYLHHVTIHRHISFDAFYEEVIKDAGKRLILLTTHGSESYLEFQFKGGDVLMLGRESAGAPDSVHEISDARVAIPIQEPLRSLNIAVAGAMVLGEALRQTGAFPS